MSQHLQLKISENHLTLKALHPAHFTPQWNNLERDFFLPPTHFWGLAAFSLFWRPVAPQSGCFIFSFHILARSYLFCYYFQTRYPPPPPPDKLSTKPYFHVSTFPKIFLIFKLIFTPNTLKHFGISHFFGGFETKLEINPTHKYKDYV